MKPIIILCMALAACGGGGADTVIETDEGAVTVSDVCEFASAEDMQRAIDAGVVCRIFVTGTREEE
jgi:hypothetical protein